MKLSISGCDIFISIMIRENTKARIDYIDLMKGVCITLVVIVHCDVKFPLDIINNMLQNLRMPLYYFLTGLFFKEYSGFWEFVIRKTNKLIIPYIFFAFIPYAFFDFFFSTQADKTCMYYFFMFVEPYNYPLWFLRSLFITYILFYVLRKCARSCKEGWCVLVVLLLSFISWKVSFVLPKGGWSFLLANFVTSVFSLPFIYVAFYVRKKGLLTMAFSWEKLAALFVVGLMVWVLCVQDNVFFINAHLGNLYPLLYLSAMGGITCLWIICRIIKKLFFFSYVGRYSIVVLGTFAPISHFLSSCFGLTGVIQAAITLALMPIMIYVSIHFFPYFTAQKDLIRIGGK